MGLSRGRYRDIFLGMDFPLKVPGFDFLGVTIGVYKDFQPKTRCTLQPSVNLCYRSNFFVGPTRWKAQGYVQWYGSRRARENSNCNAVASVTSQNREV
ncbi:hypothetical protein LJR296_007863 [Cupriavidus necator]|uniref:hypothetical protein n=1 Tax=Cupriavidus necator TaxID=106590 RepID=UPI003ED062FC